MTLSPYTAALALLVLGFLLGGLPFGLWLGRLIRGVDLRRHGSGNPGAANAFRVLGPGWGILILALDITKGWAATALLPGWVGLGTVSEGALWPLAGAVAAVAGHVFSPLARFRGGKGVATALGGFIALAPLAALAAIAGFGLGVLLTRFVSIGSLVLVIVFPIATAFEGPPPPLRGWAVTVGALLALVIAWRHRANWARIARGEESRIRWR